MRRTLHALALLLSPALSAGCGEDLDPRGDAEIDETSEIEEAFSSTPPTICDGRRWITFAASGACAPSLGFAAEPLFPANQGPPSKLAGYCLHTWSGAAPPTSLKIDAWKASLGTNDVAEDCALVTPLATPHCWSPMQARAAALDVSARLRMRACSS